MSIVESMCRPGDMPPRPAGKDSAHWTTGYAESSSYITLARPHSVFRKYAHYIRVGKLGRRMTFPRRLVGPPVNALMPLVLTLPACDKVRGVYTNTTPAEMCNLKTMWDWPIRDLLRKTVRVTGMGAATDKDIAVPGSGRGPRPIPALRIHMIRPPTPLVDFLPKSFGHTDSAHWSSVVRIRCMDYSA